jgi:hypothetical protein
VAIGTGLFLVAIIWFAIAYPGFRKLLLVCAAFVAGLVLRTLLLPPQLPSIEFIILYDFVTTPWSAQASSVLTTWPRLGAIRAALEDVVPIGLVTPWMRPSSFTTLRHA